MLFHDHCCRLCGSSDAQVYVFLTCYSYITTASTTVQMVVKAFGQMVLDNVRVPPAAGGVSVCMYVVCG